MSKTKAQELADLVNGSLGKGTVSFAADKDYAVTYTSTGLLPFDILFQGGMPSGRFVEVIGDYSTLKSYLGLCSIVEVQKRGGTAAIIDTEHAFDPSWAEGLGVDLSSLIVERPENGELAMDIMEALVRGGIDMIVVDSIAATLPAAEQEKRFHGEKVQPGRLAYLMSVALRKITTANSKTSILWINQTRLNIGVTFGSPLAVPGGKAMPYYASYRVEVKKVGKETVVVDQHDGEKWVKGRSQVGQKYKAEVMKSKLSRPFRDVLFTWNLEENSIDLTTFLISQGLETGLVSLKGNTWSYGEHKAVGREKFKALISSDPIVRATLENDVRAAHDLPPIEVPAAPAPAPVRTARKRATRKKASA